MLDWWTIGRASGFGVIAGLLALILWPIHASYPDQLLWPYVAALALAAFCGVSVLLITVNDLVQRRDRGERLRPVRGFDLSLGLLLAGPSLLELHKLLA